MLFFLCVSITAYGESETYTEQKEMKRHDINTFISVDGKKSILRNLYDGYHDML